MPRLSKGETLTKREKTFADTIAGQLKDGEKVNLAKAGRSAYKKDPDPRNDSSKAVEVVKKPRVLASISDTVDDYAKQCIGTISQSSILSLACKSIERDLQSHDTKVVKSARDWVMEAMKHFSAVKERLESLMDKSPKHLHLPKR